MKLQQPLQPHPDAQRQASPQAQAAQQHRLCAALAPARLASREAQAQLAAGQD